MKSIDQNIGVILIRKRRLKDPPPEATDNLTGLPAQRDRQARFDGINSLNLIGRLAPLAKLLLLDGIAYDQAH